MSTTIPVADQIAAVEKRLAVAEAQAEQAVTLLNQIMASPAHPAEYALREEYEELDERVDELETRMDNKATKKRATRIADQMSVLAQRVTELENLAISGGLMAQTAAITDAYGHDYGDGR